MVSKLQSVMLSAILIASCFAACEAAAAAAAKAKTRLPAAQLASIPVTGSSPANAGQGNSVHLKAMEECKSQYGGRRFGLGRDRYAYIEQCFKMATGSYPFQVNANCSMRRGFNC
jgi:hypothetical protein